MNILDIIILIPLLYGLIRGLVKGLVHELTAMVAVAAGVIGARIWAPHLAWQLAEMITMKPEVAQVISYCLVFLGIALSLHLIGKLFTKMLSAISLGGLNRVLGGLFGLTKWALITSIILNGFAFLDNKFHILKPEMKTESIAYEPVKQIASVAWKQVQEAGD